MKDNLRIRKAKNDDIKEIWKVLLESFEPYKHHYTEKAYENTVITLSEIENRIADSKKEVLVAILHNNIVGTASTTLTDKNMHIQSMAVRPNVRRKGIGWRILEKIEEIAIQKKCQTISLECFEPLIEARNLYTAFGFSRTGEKRNYHGITVFEMIKHI